MSQGEQEIVCRRCREQIPATAGNCPQCGASIRKSGTLIAVAGFGLVLAVAAAFRPSDILFFGLVGLALIGMSGYLLYDKRQRINEASEDQEDVIGTVAETDNRSS